MTAHAFRKAVARDPIERFGAANRFVDRRRAQGAGERQKSLGIAGQSITAPGQGQHPAIALERQQQATVAVPRRLAEGHDAFPVARSAVRDGKDRGGIGQIDADGSLFGQGASD
jgi:hypothetical protein